MDRPAIDGIEQETAGLRRLARALVRDEAAADDLVQDAWLVALRRGVAAPVRWFAGVLRWKAREARRAEERRRRREGAAARPEALSEDTLAHVSRMEECRRAVERLQALPEPYRRTLALHLLGGQSLARIARDQGIPPATVRTHHARGLAMLRERMDAAHEGRREPWRALLLPLAAAASGTAAAAGAGALVTAGLVVGLVVLATRSEPAAAPTSVPVAEARHPEPRAEAERGAAPVLVGLGAKEDRPVPAPTGGSSSPTAAAWSGRVVLPLGARVERIEVYAVRKDRARGSSAAPVTVAKVSDDGSFTISLDRPEEHWILSTTAYAAGLRRAWVDGATLRAGEAFALRPVPAARLRVTVLGPDGRFPEGARVTLRSAEGNEAPWPGPDDAATGVTMSGLAPDGTDLLVFHDAPVLLRVVAPRMAAWQRVLEPVDQDVRAVLGETATVTLRVRGDVVRGDVVSATLQSLGPPVAAATTVAVAFATADGSEVTLRLEDRVGPGTYAIDVHSPRHRPTRVTGVLVGASGEVVEAEARLEALPDLGALRVRFREEAAGRAPRLEDGGSVLLVRRHGDASDAWRFLGAPTATQSVVLLPHLAAGTYDLLWAMRRPSRAALVRGASVRAGETTEVSAEVEAPVWAKVPAVAKDASDAQLVARDGVLLPRFLDDGGPVRLDDPAEAPTPGRTLGPYPASIAPLRLRSSGGDVDLPTIAANPR